MARLSNKEKSKLWDAEMINIWQMVTAKSFRSQDIANHYGENRNSILALLHRRGISLVRWRHEFAKGAKFTWKAGVL
jgi:hypothetical protein